MVTRDSTFLEVLMPRYGQTAMLTAVAAVIAGGVTAGLVAVTSRTPASASAAPTVPGNPRVSGLTCKSVTFAWDAAGDDQGVTFYDVYHDGQLMKSVDGNTLSTDLTVVPGASWGLYVNARDAEGNVSQ